MGELTDFELIVCSWRGPVKFERGTALARAVIEGKAVSLLKAQLALSALAELRAGEREAAAKLLAQLARR